MKHNPPHNIEHSIEQVEKRIELRRSRIARHLEEMRDEAAVRAKPFALAGVVAVATAGFIAGKRNPAAYAYNAYNPRVRRNMRNASLLGGLLAGLQGLVTLATSPLVRAAWNSYMRRRV